MYTQCANCSTVFRVTAEVLRVAHGQVRCGVCNATFDALEALIDELPAGSETTGGGLSATGSVPGFEVEEREAEVMSVELSTPDTEASGIHAVGAIGNPQPLEAPALDDSIIVEILGEGAVESVEVGSDAVREAEKLHDTLASAIDDIPDSALEFDLPEDQWNNVFVQAPAASPPPAARVVAEEEFEAEPDPDGAHTLHLTRDDVDGTALRLVEPEEDPLADPRARPALRASALEGTGIRLEDLDDPDALDDVTLLHIPLPTDEAVAEHQPLVVQAVADAAQQRAAAAARPAAQPVAALASLEGPATVAPAPALSLDGSPIEPAPQATPDPIDAWMAPVAHRPWWQSALWTAASLLLVVGLLAQAVHFWRDDLSVHPTLGGPVKSLYSALGHAIDPPIDLLAFEVRQPDVRLTAQPGVLRVTANLLNRAAGAQPYPLLQVTLEDRFGAPLGRRAFKPEEYLPGAAAKPRGQDAGIPLLAAGARADAVLDVADPGSEAEGFELDVCTLRNGQLTCALDLRRSPAAAPP